MKTNYLEYLAKEIPVTVIATTDDIGQPVTSAIDIIDNTKNSLFFIVEKNHGLYNRLKLQKFLSLTGVKLKNHSESETITIRGMAREINSKNISDLIKKNPYMLDLYLYKKDQEKLTLFEIFDGIGEYIHLNKVSFS